MSEQFTSKSSTDDNEYMSENPTINWNLVTNDNIASYKRSLDNFLNNICIIPQICQCRDVHCSDITHISYIDNYCTAIIENCKQAGLSSFPLYKPTVHKSKPKIPEWKTSIEPLRQRSIFWHHLWQDCDKPREGHVASIMRSTRAQYHKAIKEGKKLIKDQKNIELVRQLSCKDYKGFWSMVRNMSKVPTTSTATMDGKCNEHDICSKLAGKYKDIFQSTPTNETILGNIGSSILQNINSYPVEMFKVSANDVSDVVNKLKSNKGDGGFGYNSNHLIYGSECLFMHISNLIELMISHGYTPTILSQSHIISIPKDRRGDLQSSDNYRGISLCNALCKVIDLWILSKCSHLLNSSNMQYAFKPKHSTVMCTTMVKEIISYYNNNQSDVYACLVDASKAFDKVNYGKLFQLLLDKGVPSLIIRLLFENYTDQEIYVKWGRSVSGSFNAKNGVKQGSILSPTLFTIYMDVLLCKLNEHDIGCHIGDKFYGALAYADDLILLCPSVKGLQSMINQCEIFGTEISVTFNDRKTECIKFGNIIKDFPSLYMSGNQLQWRKQVKHLGNILSSDMTDASDISYKRGIFYGNINKLIANLGSIPSSTLDMLFQSYCASFYGSQTWDLTSKYINDIFTAWQKGMRRIWKIPYQTHRCILPYLASIKMHISTQFVFRFIKFYQSMLYNENPYVSFLAIYANFNSRGTLGCNVSYIKHRFNIDIFKSCYNECINEIRQNIDSNNQLNISNAMVLEECCNIRDNILYSYLNKYDIANIIQSLCLD
jgi:hypothetical protein